MAASEETTITTDTADTTDTVINPNEEKYLQLMRILLEKSTLGEEPRGDRTGTGTYSKFGHMIEFDVSESVLLLTTKKMAWRTCLKELLFFVSGSTDTTLLEELNVVIWKGNTSREFLDDRGLEHYPKGDMGPAYGFQWRHAGADYTTCKEDYTREGIDQLSNVIEEIKENPLSRRHIVSAWNVMQIPMMALPPCHVMYQFYVEGEHLDLLFTMRSVDVFLGLPFNLFSYNCLLYMVAHVCGLKPRKLIFQGGDTHIYSNHVEQVKEQLSREPFTAATLSFARQIDNIDDFTLDDFILDGYESWPRIRAKMAV